MSVPAVQVTVELGHRAWYRKKATVSKTHDWILFVRGVDGNDISHFVEKIVYNLHESFQPPRRVRDKPPYELHESGYGEFYSMIDIYFKNKGEKGAQRKVSLQYFLNLNHKDAPPINSSRFEKINFHHPSEEFLEKVLKAGGVILDEDGIPTSSKSRLSSSNSHHGHDSRLQDTFSSDGDLGPKSSLHKGKKLKRSSEANPLSNESVSSSDSLNSCRSSKSDGSERESDILSLKRKYEAMLFDVSDEDVPKKKKKSSEKSDHGKVKPTSESKPPIKPEANIEKKHRSHTKDGHGHSSGKTHRDGGSTKDHEHHRSQSSNGSGKQKSGGSSSRSSSRTPQKTPTKNPEKTKFPESRSHSHGGGGGSSGHYNGSSSSSNSTGNSKGSVPKGSSSHHGNQSQKSESQHHGSSKHRDPDKRSDGLAKKLISSDVQVRLSPMDFKYSSSETNSRVTGPSQDAVSNGKSTQMSPLKYTPKAAPLSSPSNSSDAAGKRFDGVNQGSVPESLVQNRPKYDKLLADMKSDDEEEDGEIRSPMATEAFDLQNWRKNGDKKVVKQKDGITSESKRSSKSSSHPDKASSESSRTSPKKHRSENSSSNKVLTATVSDKGSAVQPGTTHGKTAKKPHAKENLISDSNSSIPSKTSDSRPHEQKDSGERKSEMPAKHKPRRTERVPSIERSSLPTGDDYRDDLLENMLVPLYDKGPNDMLKKGDDPQRFSYPDRAPNGELLTSLVMIKQRLSDMTNIQLLSQIADVIEASGKFKIDEENFEFDLCDLDAETVQKVKELMESE